MYVYIHIYIYVNIGDTLYIHTFVLIFRTDWRDALHHGQVRMPKRDGQKESGFGTGDPGLTWFNLRVSPKTCVKSQFWELHSGYTNSLKRRNVRTAFDTTAVIEAFVPEHWPSHGPYCNSSIHYNLLLSVSFHMAGWWEIFFLQCIGPMCFSNGHP